MSAPMTEISLVLEDGSVFEGEAIGHIPENGIAAGEVVFNTALTGYQEVITDPSYAGQIITFTTTHIGNYGVTAVDAESRGTFARGVIVRDMARRRRSWRSETDLNDLLVANKLPGIAGLDTRRLTRLLRDSGSLRGAFGTASEANLLSAARDEHGTSGIDLVSQVTTPQPYTFGSGKYSVVAYDFGIKTTILRCLSEIATVTVVPSHMGAEEVLALKPQGIFLSNGPGDPEMVAGATAAIRNIVENGVPTFGICLGHQLLARAAGLDTFKMHNGHRGSNHPVLNLRNNRSEITSQNHGFAVHLEQAQAASHLELTHINLNDQTVEGLALRDRPAFSVQYHPESNPGPHDSHYLFDDFVSMMD